MSIETLKRSEVARLLGYNKSMVSTWAAKGLFGEVAPRSEIPISAVDDFLDQAQLPDSKLPPRVRSNARGLKVKLVRLVIHLENNLKFNEQNS